VSQFRLPPRGRAGEGFATDAGFEVVNRRLQCTADAATRATTQSNACRATCACTGGTNEVMRLIVSRALLGN
jgi:alkylation response protein AidB-like acyl-CoA dehydrogenase